MRISIQPARKEIDALLYLGFPVHSSPCVIEVDSFMKTLHVIADDRVNCIIVSIIFSKFLHKVDELGTTNLNILFFFFQKNG